MLKKAPLRAMPPYMACIKAVIPGDDDLLQFPIETIGIACAIVALGNLHHRGADGPAGEILDVSLQPAALSGLCQ